MSRKKLARIKYSKLVKEGSFLFDYLLYLSKLETAHAYDFWTGCFLLSSSVQRNIVVNRPGAPVYLNLYLILVAESGVTRKSTSVRKAADFARELCSDNPVFIENKTTPEYLEFTLWKQSEEYGSSGAIIAVSELATFLGKEKYVETMPALLTDLYDSPSLKSGGGTLADAKAAKRDDSGLLLRRHTRNVFVSFLSASTPSWLLRAVNPDVIEGGFTSRVCFIVSEEPKGKYAFPEPLSDTLAETLRTKLAAIQDKARTVSKIEISEGARRTFDRWYKSRNHYRDPFRSSFQSREDDHILRLSALLCINDDTWVIQHVHILAAIKVITQVREDGASIFEGTGSNSKLIVGIDKIRDKLLAAGINGLSQSEITKAVAPYMNAEHMKAALDIMHELEMVQQFQGVQLGKGRPTTIWRGTNNLIKPKALDTIIESYAPTRN